MPQSIAAPLDAAISAAYPDPWELDAAPCDFLATLTPDERAEYAASCGALDTAAEAEALQIAAAYRADMREARKHAADHNRGLKEQMLAEGLDIVDATYDMSIEEADKFARALGYRSNSWGDGRNVTRREKTRRRNIRQSLQADRLRQTVAWQQAQREAPLPVAPEPTPQELAVARVAAHYADLTAKHPGRAPRLAASQAWQQAQLPVTLARLAGKLSEAAALELWEVAAKRAADKKVEGL